MDDYVLFSNDCTLKFHHLKSNKTFTFELENPVQLCKPVPLEFCQGSKNFVLIADNNEIALININQEDKIHQLCSKELSKRMDIFNGGLRSLSL